MKKLLFSSLFGCAIFVLCHPGIYAQESKAGKVTVTITQDDKVVSDTTFELREDQDPEATAELSVYKRINQNNNFFLDLSVEGLISKAVVIIFIFFNLSTSWAGKFLPVSPEIFRI